MTQRLFIILITLILVIIIIAYYIYKYPNDNIKHKPHNTNTHTSPPRYRRPLTTVENNKTPSKGLESTINSLRMVHQTCPCSPGFVCVNGICKSGPTGPCVASGDCMSSEICINNLCTSAPKNWEEKGVTGYDGEELLLNSHAMILNNNKMMVVPTWWSISDIVSIVDANIDNFYYILTDNSQIYMALEDRIVRSISSITLNNLPMNYKPVKLINLDGSILILMRNNNRLYLFATVCDKSTWSVAPVENLGEHKIEEDLIDIQVATNNDTVIIYGKHWCIYHHELKSWSTIKSNNKVLYIGNSYHNHIVHDLSSSSWFFYTGIDNIRIPITPKVGRSIISATIDPSNCYSIITVDDLGNCIRRTYPRLTLRNLRNEIRTIPKNKELSRKLGQSIIRTKRSSFLITTQTVINL